MKTAEIAQRYLDYFEKNGHTIVPSASLVTDDPALLFTVAGMVPFIPYLSGDVPAPYARAADNQKCIRTNDIEEVGKTPRHGTFFQMLGNWSFGDYFKEGAITFAWELLTSSEADGGLGFDPKDLWVTVYEEDDEARELWLRIAGLPDERIQRLGKDTNYWSTGLPGPAGPCSEIFFDRGPAYGIDGGPATDDDRYVEIWNLVFMQYEITDVRSKYDFTIVGELPAKNIDTGMGLERIAFIKQGVDNMYETDQVRPVLDKAVELAGKTYGADHEDDVRFRVIADHIRSSLMLLSDGVTPSNEGRGYILRRLMRRAIRAMRLLGVDGPTFADLFAASRDAMKDAYPVVASDYERLSRYALAEEATFLRTLAAGSEILDESVAQTTSRGGTQLSGSQAFLLHDTYGFPIDLTLEIAEEAGLSVDRDAFDALMKEQRDRAKADARSRKRQLADTSVYRDFRAQGETVFTGYSDLETESRVLGVLVDGLSVDRATQGQIAEVILAETALYAESGGQVADKGIIVGPGFELEVLDVQKPVAGLISHTVEVTTGEVGVGQPATAVVDAANRRAAQQAHSATHLVHAALRDTLGKTATQAGSLNRAGYLRFDFAWGEALSPDTRTEIEEIANNAVRDNLEVTTRVMSLDEAKSLGAMALFGEKYGETVRMVDIGGPWSRELCAGTHVASSAEIGLINLVGESSVGASNRRVEALVGLDAFRELAAERAIVSQLTSSLKTPRDQLPTRIAELAASLKAAEKKIAAFESKALGDRLPALVDTSSVRGPYRVVAESLGTAASTDDVRSLALQVRDRLGAEPAVAALGAAVDGRPVVIVTVNEAARAAGAKAGVLAKAAAAILGGGGGGRDDIAQGGGADAAALPAALAAVKDALGAA
ncbi:alanine--tRNA ligase [Microbacterium terricola]|uniref:Alanine--tRNA ligase n=1 Tax=Microbacterium terricola TaxID=344163 RepID=A0ABM8DYK6_9MICO|nr:alanine--tRNA ligase [Microbacterium terricola]UYK38711.1 alanine--tRNA ligase [Microbacterium terricola]BDV30600.1 alanine--tRNA ligase [Microbacterium terricola]